MNDPRTDDIVLTMATGAGRILEYQPHPPKIPSRQPRAENYYVCGGLCGSVGIAVCVTAQSLGADSINVRNFIWCVVLLTIPQLGVFLAGFFSMLIVVWWRQRRAGLDPATPNPRLFSVLLTLISFPTFQYIACKLVAQWHGLHYIGGLSVWHFLPEWMFFALLFWIFISKVHDLGERHAHWVFAGLMAAIFSWTTVCGGDFIARQVTQSWDQLPTIIWVPIALTAVFGFPWMVASTFGLRLQHKRRRIVTTRSEVSTIQHTV